MRQSQSKADEETNHVPLYRGTVQVLALKATPCCLSKLFLSRRTACSMCQLYVLLVQCVSCAVDCLIAKAKKCALSCTLFCLTSIAQNMILYCHLRPWVVEVPFCVTSVALDIVVNWLRMCNFTFTGPLSSARA